MVIYRSVPALIQMQKVHVHKVGGKTCNCVHYDYGDVPTAVLTKKNVFMEVVNARGNSYATRNARRFRNKRLYSRKDKNRQE